MPASMLRLAGALPALRRATPVRVMSSAPAAFDGELSMLYTKIFEQHAHQRGPWKKMLAAVREAVPPGQQAAILDLATGPGEPATTIARELPKATVWATDVSGDMLAKAQTRMSGLPNARFAKLDMQDLSQFDDATFDVVTVCYGFMFARDKPQSVRESHRVLKPGGRLIATYWTENAMLKLLQQTMAGVLGGVPPPFEIDPLCLAPEGLFHSMLKDAGFATTEYSVGAYPFDLGTDPDTQYVLGTMIAKEKLDSIPSGHAKAKPIFLSRLNDYLWDPDIDRNRQPGGVPDPGAGVKVGPNRFVLAIATKAA